MKKFWNFVKNEETSETELLFNGPISEESWYGDEVTPALFRDELAKVSGNLTVWLNSPGGDVFAASQIYTMLRNHKGKVTVKIDALAASAASVVAMAGDETFIAPTAMLMIHDPATIAMGNKSDMEKAITLLEEVKESIINAYEMKTHLSRAKIAKMMSDETWLNAKKAKQLGFVDGILFDKEKMPQAEMDDETPDEKDEDENEKKPPKDMVSFSYTPSRTVASFMQKVSANPTGTPIAQLDKRLELLKY
ncbi:MAG: Clp protease ClpP [Ruminococcus sp.]|nr:Clp protease ClpP [Ruminococcus sp.]